MSEKDYEFGARNGNMRSDAEYGSDAYWANGRGVDAYNAEQLAQRTMHEQQSRGPSASTMQGPAGSVLVVALICAYFAFNWLFTVTESWQAQPHPYKLIALFYYVLVTLPLSGFGWVWSQIIFKLFDGYSLLSVLTALVAEGFYLLFLAMMAGVLAALLKRLRIGAIMLLAPAVLALVWFFGARYL